MNASEDDPHRLDEAIACFDLSGISPERRRGGRFAFQLEFVLRSTNISTTLITDLTEGTDCEIGENIDIRIRLHWMPDGRWLFESKTLEALPKISRLPVPMIM